MSETGNTPNENTSVLLHSYSFLIWNQVPIIFFPGVLFQVMAWHQIDNKPLLAPIMTGFTFQIYQQASQYIPTTKNKSSHAKLITLILFFFFYTNIIRPHISHMWNVYLRIQSAHVIRGHSVNSGAHTHPSQTCYLKMRALWLVSLWGDDITDAARNDICISHTSFRFTYMEWK